MERFRVDFYNITLHGYCYDKTRYFYNLTIKDVYKYLARYAKINRYTNLIAIYVCKENLPNVEPIFSIHVGNNIFLENSKTFRCIKLD